VTSSDTASSARELHARDLGRKLYVTHMAILERAERAAPANRDQLEALHANNIDEINRLAPDGLWPLLDSLMFAMNFHQYLARQRPGTRNATADDSTLAQTDPQDPPSECRPEQAGTNSGAAPHEQSPAQ
jgi:hypothetical protein